jgi:dihydrofolate reductase
MTVSIIAAVAHNGVIGRKNRLPWHIPEDFKWFKAKTQGRPVIMGRKTFESIGRVLPGRRNLILSTMKAYSVPGAETHASLEEALASCASRGDDEVFIIGGEKLFREALPLSSRLYLTVIHRDFEGDALFPEIPEREFVVVFEEGHVAEPGRATGAGAPEPRELGLSYTFRILERVSPAPRS